jgi:cytochrome c oxidase assembly protein subunit 15
MLVACLALSCVQIALGTNVREAIDHIALDLGADRRAEWVGAIGLSVLVHRSLSIVILFTNAAAVWMIRRNPAAPAPVNWAGYGLLACIAAEIGIGAILYYFAVPAVLQPVHLLLAAVMAGLQWYLWIATRATASAAEPATGQLAAAN